MTHDEIASYLKVGAGRIVTVDIRVVFGGVRSVRIRGNNKVLVEFDAWGHQEGGVYFRRKYADLPNAVSVLAAYLGEPVEDWHNYSSSGAYPERPSESSSWVEALGDGRLELPGDDFEPIGVFSEQIWRKDIQG
jgi:hypothetical protein